MPRQRAAHLVQRDRELRLELESAQAAFDEAMAAYYEDDAAEYPGELYCRISNLKGEIIKNLKRYGTATGADAPGEQTMSFKKGPSGLPQAPKQNQTPAKESAWIPSGKGGVPAPDPKCERNGTQSGRSPK